ncbi:MAG: hypothetical protein KatS3mg107_0423 [Gemmataceae bacterium]|nr:MAG: hypothetical protein KatS3mg107_0423 [Gemmataceae bacterium]
MEKTQCRLSFYELGGEVAGDPLKGTTDLAQSKP